MERTQEHVPSPPLSILRRSTFVSDVSQPLSSNRRNPITLVLPLSRKFSLETHPSKVYRRRVSAAVVVAAAAAAADIDFGAVHLCAARTRHRL